MKRTFLTLIAISMVLLFSLSSAYAVTTVNLVQTADPVFVGDTITLEVYVNPDFDLFGGTLAFTFDSGLVTYSEFNTGTDVNTGSDYAGFTFDFANDPDGLTAGGSYNVGQLVFDADAVGTAVFGLTAIPDWANTSFVLIDPTSFVVQGTSVQITAVPIPGAFLLLGSGLIGLVGLRRKLS